MSIIQKLLVQYPNARQADDIKETDYDQFTWYQDRQLDEIIAFPKNELAANEVRLIKLMLEPCLPPVMNNSNEWNQFLFGEGLTCPIPPQTVFRVVFFSFDQTPEVDDHEHPLKFVFSEDATIIHRDELNGYVIEPQTPNTLSLEEISSASQALETDLSVKTYFFVGSFHEVNESTKEVILMELEWLNQQKSHVKRQRVASTQSVIPLVILDRFTDFEWQAQFSIIYNAYDADPELAMVIRTLVENLSNVSSTAKLLYLHRNSLQYRLDKFSERTGIDLKSFHGSLTAYLASLQWETVKRTH